MKTIWRSIRGVGALALVMACSAGDTPQGSAAGDGVSDENSLGGATLASGESTGLIAQSLTRSARRRLHRRHRPSDPCASVRCAAGTHCEADGRRASCVADDPCALTDCPPDAPVCAVVDGEAVCQPAEPPAESVFCGGIAAFECPGAGTCVDDPDDGCDPENGGADCGGLCECNVRALCIRGLVFDASPAVCACVPEEPPVDACAAVRCAAGTHCELVDGAATCAEDNPCALTDCPPDRPVCEVVDGEAVCTAAAAGPFCGGIAAFECPGLGSCADDPNDGCDPANGGADCGGVCECNVRALCIRGLVFDASPDVCACVPDAAAAP